MRSRNRALGAMAVCVAFAAAACGGAPPETAPAPSEAASAVQLEQAPTGQALLYLFNASGWTLFQSNYDVKADGRRIADLPRNAYTVVAIDTGKHRLESAGRKLDVALAAGERQFVVVAYQPDKSWGFPFFGSPLMFATVNEAQAKTMITKFKRRDIPLS